MLRKNFQNLNFLTRFQQLQEKNLPLKDVPCDALPHQQTETAERFEQADRPFKADGRHVDAVHLHNLVAHLEAALGGQFALLDRLHKDPWTADGAVHHRAAQTAARVVTPNVQLLFTVRQHQGKRWW